MGTTLAPDRPHAAGVGPASFLQRCEIAGSGCHPNGGLPSPDPDRNADKSAFIVPAAAGTLTLVPSLLGFDSTPDLLVAVSAGAADVGKCPQCLD